MDDNARLLGRRRRQPEKSLGFRRTVEGHREPNLAADVELNYSFAGDRRRAIVGMRLFDCLTQRDIAIRPNWAGSGTLTKVVE